MRPEVLVDLERYLERSDAGAARMAAWMIESTDLLIVGCGPAGGVAAREAASRGLRVVVLEKDAVVGSKRVCAAGLRPGFCREFDLPDSLVHCNTPRLALFDPYGDEYAVRFGPGHTSTREELDGTIAARAVTAGAEIRTNALFRELSSEGGRTLVEYADTARGERRRIAARHVFLAQGSTAKLERHPRFAFSGWASGLMTTLQQRWYLARPAAPIAYETLELHYYPARDGRTVVAWMFPKRDHLAIGLGITGKVPGAELREELDEFAARTIRRLAPGIEARVKLEGHLLYGGMPRPTVGADGVSIGGTAAGLVDATNGEGIYEAATSGRMLADFVWRYRDDATRASAAYSRALHDRFYARLARRVKLIEFLSRRPKRFRLLFEQFAAAPRFAELVANERFDRTWADRIFLYAQAARFGARSLLA